MDPGRVNPIILFDTTHHALWAEELALARGLGVDVVPAPAASNAKCDLALAFLPEDESVLLGLLEREVVPYRLFEG